MDDLSEAMKSASKAKILYWFSVKWRADASVSEYSANLGWHEEAADRNCNWFQKGIRVDHCS
jgi:hypothetical protein